MHEYFKTSEYERDVRHRRRDGWRVVSVLQRPGKPSRLRRLVVGSGLAKPETEYLVTYNRPYQHQAISRPLTWLLSPALAAARPRRWVWLVVALFLAALLLYGFVDFFADAVPF